MSRRSFACFISLLVAPLTVAHAQIIKPPPCTPCGGPGACAPTDPILSSETHRCENHGGHDHSGLVLVGNDLRQIMFSSGSLVGTQFIECKLTKAYLYNVDLTGGAMIDCGARQSVLIDATLANVDLSGTNLSKSRLDRADLTGSLLVANLSSARLDDADLTGATLSVGRDMADFSNADLSHVLGLQDTVGVATYSPCTDFSGTGFDPVAAGWILTAGAPIGTSYCDAADNSTGSPAAIAARGCVDAATNSFRLEASGLPPGQFGYFLCSQTQDFVANPGGSQGNLCIGGTVGPFVNDVRESSWEGRFWVDVDLSDLPPPFSGVSPGETWNFTAWYRDRNPMTTSNFTNGVSVTFE